MNFKIVTEENLSEFLNFVSQELGFTFSEDGLPLTLKKEEGILKIDAQESKISITYQEKAHLFRALTIMVARFGEYYHLSETPQFKEIGPMMDFSRNAIMSVEGLKRYIILCAKMGLNSIMLYLEDTYEIPEYPYFGYLRGRYSQKEISELCEFGDFLGVEVIPAIQTLGHLKNPLKWSFANGMKDTDDTLLVGEDKTYEFLEAAIRSIKKSFKTNKIHIGMDEAHNLGRGRYLDKHKEFNQLQLMKIHLKKVTDICEKYDLHPMMWSDMFFRLGSKIGDYYDTEVHIPQKVAESMPDIDMVYWDYYHENQNVYDSLIKAHKELNRPVIFAGGLWIWNGLAPNFGKAIATSQAGLTSAKQNHVDVVYATLWGDDGGETPFISALFGLQLYAEHQFHQEVSMEFVKKQFTLFHHLKGEDFLLLNEFDATPGIPVDNLENSNASKLLLYQDILYGTYEKTLANYPLKTHYKQLAEKLKSVTVNSDTEEMFVFYLQLAEVLTLKADVGINIQKAYTDGDRDALKAQLVLLDQLKTSLEKLASHHRKVWYQWNKAFGFEVMDLRYGSLILRIETAKARIHSFLVGEIEHLEELEVEKLTYDKPNYFGNDMVGFGFYENIYTVSKISGV